MKLKAGKEPFQTLDEFMASMDSNEREWVGSLKTARAIYDSLLKKRDKSLLKRRGNKPIE